ncbi:hypothetical protein GQ42DRAFT_159829, partial [Ramicandelaber brevisporus]
MELPQFVETKHLDTDPHAVAKACYTAAIIYGILFATCCFSDFMKRRAISRRL